MARKYATTTARIKVGDPIPDPIPPEGQGWSLRGGGSVPSQSDGETVIQWCWENELLLADRQDDGDQVLTQEMPARR